jgi:hypothetical protein
MRKKKAKEVEEVIVNEYADDTPIRRYAEVQEGTITQVVVSGPRFADDHGLILVEGIEPEPAIGWVRNKRGKFTQPQEEI